MSKISELYNKRANAWENAKRFLDEHTDANGRMSAEDSAVYERMEADITSLTDSINRYNRQQEIESQMDKPANSFVGGDIDKSGGKGIASESYRKAFFDAMRMKTIDSSIRDALEEGTAAEGGYLVPTTMDKKIVDQLADENVIRPLATTITTKNGDHKIPVVSSHGAADWTDEEAAYNDSDDAFTQVSLSAYKLTRLVKVSEELLADSAFDIEAYLVSEFARSFGAAEETAFATGNGTGKPTGLTNASAGATLGVTTSSPTAIAADEIIDLYHALRVPYRRKAVWLMNDAIVKAIRKLKDLDGQYLWQPGLKDGQPDTLLNRPVYNVTSMESTVAAGKIVMLFGDLKYYWIADRGGRTFRRLNELYAATGQVGFIANQRVDGKLILREAVQMMKMHA